MCFFFGEKRKLERAKKKIQENCTHDWRVVLEHRTWCHYQMEYRNMCDLYCPICEAEKENIGVVDAKKYINIVKERKEYEKTI